MANETVKEKEETIKEKSSQQIEQMKSMLTEKLGKLDAQIKELSGDIKNKYVPAAETKMKDNLLVSLLVSFASGLTLGLIFLLMSFIGGGKKR